MPKVSVILSSYNHAPYIAEAIQSVLNQTFTDFELIIFDDGSTDNSRDIIRSFTDSRLKLLLHEKNRGPFLVAREALDMADGKYIAVHHSDDIWEADKLAKQVAFLEEHKEYVACFTWAKFIDESGNIYEPAVGNIYHGIFEQKNRSREEWLHDLFFRGNFFCHPSLLAKLDTYRTYGVQRVRGIYQLPDYYAWVRFALHGDIFVIPERLTRFRLRRGHQDNMSADTLAAERRSQFELYKVMQAYRTIDNVAYFLRVFPEAAVYEKNGHFNIDYAFSQMLLSAGGAARRLLAREILLEILNNPASAAEVASLYGFTEKKFVRDGAGAEIFAAPAGRKVMAASLFYDTGEGFLADKRLSQNIAIRSDGHFIAVFHLPPTDNIQALRFDPAEEAALVLRVDSVQVGEETALCEPQGAYQKNGDMTAFFNADPMYFIKWQGGGDRDVIIKGFRPVNESAFPLMQQMLSAAKAKNNALKNELHKTQNELNERRTELELIHASRGYRMLKCYYRMRDNLLPPGSRRRLLLKTAAWGVLHVAQLFSLLNRENIGKAWAAFRYGGVRQLLARVDRKLHSEAVTALPRKNSYGNAWLKDVPLPAWPEGAVIDILVPVYNACAFARKCIDTVYENTAVPYNLYIIDDASPDEGISVWLQELAKKESPSFLRELKILRNEENLGFIGSVNRGLALCQNHVVLLNTDVELPPHWLERLAAPVWRDDTIASVTPFANSAEICSFPQFCANNDLPAEMSLNEVDAVFAHYGGEETVDIPTGVGFCMLLNRECLAKWGVLDSIYGKGYAEENDWCCRMAAHGYRSVQVTNLFVYHKHGASFAEHKDKSKEERIQENLAKLAERYPDYQKRVADYIALDPCRDLRRFLLAVIEAGHNKDKKGVMFLNHSMGGGAQLYQDGLAAKWQDTRRVYGMEPLADGRTLRVKAYTKGDSEEIAFFDLYDMTAPLYKNMLDALEINLIYVNQLVTYPMPDILHWIEETKIPYVFFGHDFYAACPRYKLLDENFVYCEAEIRPDVCNRCLKRSPAAPYQDIEAWRQNFGAFLSGAKEVIVPSQNTAELLGKYYKIPMIVREHTPTVTLMSTYKDEFACGEELTVAVVGAIGEEKGSRILYELVKYIDNAESKVRLVIIGITNQQNEAYTSPTGKFIITGPYDNHDISNLLAAYRAALVLIPAIWPETFSYTTSEAANSGYPVMAFDIGAPSERIRRYDCGWLVKERTSRALWEKICTLVNERDEILNKAHNCLKIEERG